MATKFNEDQKKCVMGVVDKVFTTDFLNDEHTIDDVQDAFKKEFNACTIVTDSKKEDNNKQEETKKPDNIQEQPKSETPPPAA